MYQKTKAGFVSLWPNKTGHDPEAAIAFTSGSSNTPKAVQYSDKNILTNIRDVAPLFNLTQADSAIAIAPPFHSLGLTGNLIMPSLLGLRTHYFANTTDGKGIVKAISEYKTTLLIGPPNLLRDIFRAAKPGDLNSLRYVVTGAEALTEDTYNFLKSKAPNAEILEGAGATETSPIWAINPPGAGRLGYVGKVLPSVTSYVVDNESLTEAVATRNPIKIRTITPDKNGVRRGELILSGDSVITQYYKNAKPEAFFDWNGRTYYRTEDEVEITADGYVKILGRYSRQHKAEGGEMINHQMIERVLSQYPPLLPGEDGKPTTYIGADKTKSGKIVTTLVTTRDVDLNNLNHFIGQSLSQTWYVRSVVKVPEIPLLGTGKVDGKSCNSVIKEHNKLLD